MPTFAALLAAASLNIASSAAAPPGPRTLTPADINDWAAHNVWPLGYFRFDIVEGAVSYLNLIPEQDLAAPVVRVWVRYEYFQPRTINSRTVQSVRFVHDLDCAQGLARTLTAEGFPELNLQGTPDVVRMDSAWNRPEPGTPGARQLAFLCEAKGRILAGPAPGAKAPAAAPVTGPPPPRSGSDADIDAWIAENLDLRGGYRFEYQANAVVLLYAREEPAPGKVMPLEVRHEYFRPIAAGGRQIRSDRLYYELDCDRGTARLTRASTFPDLDQQGEEGGYTVPNPTWGYPSAGQEVGRVLALMCREAREPGYALSVQKGPRETEPPAPSQQDGGRVIPRRN